MAEAEGSSPLLLPPPPLPPGMAEVEAPTAAETDMKQIRGPGSGAMDVERSRFPYCVVWTPIPGAHVSLLRRQPGGRGGARGKAGGPHRVVGRPRATLPRRRAGGLLPGPAPAPAPARPSLQNPCHLWFFPIIGHMGICTSTGVIRDFAGPYFVSEDNMAFGKPAKYWKLDPAQVYASGPNAWDTAVHDASEEYKHRMHNLCCDNCHSHVALALNLMRYNNSTNWNMVTLCFSCLLYGKYVSFGAFVKTWLPFILLLGIILTVSLVLNLR
nr:transmembrane protein 222 [Loxodonta africana]